MSKDFDDYKDSDYDKNPGSYDYDDEISRKAVGKLLTGLDDEDDSPAPAPVKPVVRAVRINSEKIKKEKINTSFYDESRSKRNTAGDDAIVTGFREEEEPPEEFPQAEESPPPDEDMGDAIRTRRPNIFKADESGSDREEREKYRKQFLGGYTDHRRRGLDITGPAAAGDIRKLHPASSEEEPVKRVIPSRAPKEANEPEAGPVPRRRSQREEIQDTKPPRSRRAKNTDEELPLVSGKRSERKERQAFASASAAPAQAPSYDAPIFKIIAAVLLIMLIAMVVLVFNVIGANGTISELEEQIAGFENDLEDFASYRMENITLQQQVRELTEERGTLQLRVGELESELLSANVADTTGGYTDVAVTATGEMQSYTVRAGDNLTAIAAQFRLGPNGVDAIMQANNLATTTIAVGQILVIPSP